MLAAASPRTRVLQTPAGRIAALEAGSGEPVVLLHRLGGTKESFRGTVAALSDAHHVVALDLPGFGDSDKPLRAPYDAPWLARAVTAALDELDLGPVHLLGNSLGGRVALEIGLAEPERVGSLSLLAPALPWLRRRELALPVRMLRPEVGALAPVPSRLMASVIRGAIPAARRGPQRERVDELLHACSSPRGRAALSAAARAIYLDEPNGAGGLWKRLPALAPRALFVWGRRDALVPVAFRRHVERVLPSAVHVEIDCGHVAHLERPRETTAAIRSFLAGGDPAVV